MSENPSGDVATNAAEPASVASPATMTARLPNWSTSRPDSGASANMPSVCAESIVPIAARSWPCSCIDRGAAVITATITTCAVTIVAAAERTEADRNTDVRSAAGAPVCRARGAASDASNAPTVASAASTNGPVIGVQPIAAAARCDGMSSNGPPTAPMAPAQISEPIAVPRRSGGYRSAAA